MTTTDTHTCPPVSPLVAQLMEFMLSDTKRTTDFLIGNLTAARDDAEAMLAAVRAGVIAVLDGPYAPAPGAIEAALSPSEEMVAQYRKDQANVPL